MKKFKPALWILSIVILLSSCHGEQGPPGPTGPQGPQGPSGPETVGLMYEVQFNLNSQTNWGYLYSFPSQDVIYQDDVVLVYLLMDNVNGQDVWKLMPVNYFYDVGILSITYDFTVNDVNIYAEASYTLDPSIDHFENLIARIVVVPAGASPNQRTENLNYQNFNEVKAAFQLKEPIRVSTPNPFLKVAKTVKRK